MRCYVQLIALFLPLVCFGQPFSPADQASAALCNTPGLSFSPSDISGLIRWYKADAITGKSDGDIISTWTDSSGNVNATAYFGSGYEPYYAVNVFNSLPGVLFTNISGGNNSSKGFFIGKPVAGTGKALTLFLVYKKHDANAAMVPVCLQNNGASPYKHRLNMQDQADNRFYVEMTGGAGYIFKSGDPSGLHLITVTLLENSATGCTASYDGGTPAVTDTTGTTFASSDATESTLGLATTIDQFWTGYMAEFLLYNSVLSSSDQTSVIDYLKAKWGTP